MAGFSSNKYLRRYQCLSIDGYQFNYTVFFILYVRYMYVTSYL